MAYRPPHLRGSQAQAQARPISEGDSSAQPRHGSGSGDASVAGPSGSKSRTAQTANGSSRTVPQAQRVGQVTHGRPGPGPQADSHTRLQSPPSDMKPMRRLHEVQLDEMELIQSVSRSGGDGAEGDALKDTEVQERFRKYIDQRIEKHYSTFATARETAPLQEKGEEVESLSSLVLQFRKLREGVIASGRIDEFAIEVFESSARFAILAKHTSQLMSSLSGLVPGLYQAVNDRKGKGKSRDSDFSTTMGAISLHEAMDNRTQFASILLLLQLVQSESTGAGAGAFHSTFTQLTSPTSQRLYPKLQVSSSSSSTSISPDRRTRAMIPRSSLIFAIRASRALSTERFDPLTYFSLLQDERVSTYERIVLSWSEGRVRDRAWEVMKRAYVSTGIGWAGRFVGEKGEDWVVKRGTTCVDGVVKLR